MYGFLLSGKWIGYLLLTALFALVCAGLGMWQLDRRREVLADINRITSNYSAAPVPYEQARGEFQSLDASREWSQVRLVGRYDVAGQRIVRNRPFNGQPGYEVLVPLRLVNGDSVVIDRGWLPIGNQQAGRPDSVPAPPAGQVTVTARLKPGEPVIDRGAPAGQLASINLPAYGKELGYPLMTGAYGLLASESPAASAMPVQFPMPSLDEGPHLSYAMQWFAFGVLFFVGYGYAARQQAISDRLYADEDAEDDEVQYAAVRPDRPRPVRRRRRPTAEEEEDALLDAQGL
ncbi:SURF1 family protein [Paenarthrobacter sp. DKR-5]|uniref:SURF1 family cytochrome oxidase biogenesis protein n=1 Tax=Paenarthrobacter sp. DKR-5 TaxID=2835535 RepID=UPI001BDBC5B9|nr:SURF1 family protein [Paenarthrobacter sp. DKR-5]MBT1001835.1 SURF1 family protein [Paenarthrobacter sp. DKR-5]